MKKTEDILERLKGQMPSVPDSDILTDSIMDAIAKADHRAETIPLWIKVIRFASSAAAVILIALFIGLNGQKPISAGETAMTSKEIKAPMSLPALNDKGDALEMHKYRIERRKLRQSKQTRIENLYAEI